MLQIIKTYLPSDSPPNLIQHLHSAVNDPGIKSTGIEQEFISSHFKNSQINNLMGTLTTKQGPIEGKLRSMT